MRGTDSQIERFAPRGPLRGTASVPGDKSISHRALILAALAVGESRIDGLGDGDDVAATIEALRAMGADLRPDPTGSWFVRGVGVGGLMRPDQVLDLRNSGTAARLLTGLVAGHPIRAVITGDASLRRRPMDRVAVPLRRIGARLGGKDDRLPLVVDGAVVPLPCHHRIAVPSAQVKSALLLAGLNAPGLTVVEEAIPTRDHLERLLLRFGARIRTDGRRIALTGETDLRPQALRIAGDFSAAAFLIVAALVVPGSEIRLERIGLNPRRTGLLEVLRRMGADLRVTERRAVSGEPVGTIVARHGALRGVNVARELVADTIDEFPILFVAAAFANGTTRAGGLSELRLKESDRLSAMARGLRDAGVDVREGRDGLEIGGSGGRTIAGGSIAAAGLDHRVAMAFAVAGLHADQPIGVDGMRSADTSFPGFCATLDGLSGQ